MVEVNSSILDDLWHAFSLIIIWQVPHSKLVVRDCWSRSEADVERFNCFCGTWHQRASRNWRVYLFRRVFCQLKHDTYAQEGGEWNHAYTVIEPKGTFMCWVNSNVLHDLISRARLMSNMYAGHVEITPLHMYCRYNIVVYLEYVCKGRIFTVTWPGCGVMLNETRLTEFQTLQCWSCIWLFSWVTCWKLKPSGRIMWILRSSPPWSQFSVGLCLYIPFGGNTTYAEELRSYKQGFGKAFIYIHTALEMYEMAWNGPRHICTTSFAPLVAPKEQCGHEQDCGNGAQQDENIEIEANNNKSPPRFSSFLSRFRITRTQ